jgi:cleavage stimulation factor subunit 3
MNDNLSPPGIKIEPSDELNNFSNDYSSTMNSSPPPAASLSGRPTTSLDVLPDSSQTTSHAPALDVSSMSNAPPTSNLLPPPPSSSMSPPARNPLASLQSAKRKRLPQDKVGQLEDRIALDARDADAWLALIQEHKAKGKISDARNTYERFFKVFPDLVIHLQVVKY